MSCWSHTIDNLHSPQIHLKSDSKDHGLGVPMC
jgi:hypothetical protein